jgi:putative ABC transport system permease protein
MSKGVPDDGGFWVRLRRTLGGEHRDSEFEQEVEEHIQLLAERYRRQGMPADDAVQAARRQFGNTTLLREDRRAMRIVPALDVILRDLAYAWRVLRKNPGFAMAAVLTLALGIGANTVIFSVCNAVLLRPLPFREPERIVVLWERMKPNVPITVAPANFVDWRNGSRSFAQMAALNPNASFILSGQSEAARLTGASVSANFFSVLGVRLAIGRDFLSEEERVGQNRVVILSHRAWQERFGGNREIAGKSVVLNDTSYSVAGVLPADFQFAIAAADFQARSQFDIWTPLALDPQKLQRGTHPLRVIARLKPGVELAQAQAEMNVIAANLTRQFPWDNRDKGIAVVPFQEQVTGKVRGALQALLVAVGLVLLIACANVANLVLSRAAAREKEMVVRVALGASRGRLAQQLLVESLLLAGMGGAAGLLLALAAGPALAPYLPADLSRAAGATLDVRILVFTAVISLTTGVAFGIAPLFGTRQLSLENSLRQNSRSIGGARARMRNALAAAQIAIAIVLLIGAGLVAKSFWALIHVPKGFRSKGVVTARLSLPRSRYPDNRRIAAFERDLQEHLHGRPGIQTVGFTTYLPLSGSDNGWAFFIEGQPPLPVGVFTFAKYRPVSAGYFEAIGIPMLSGRTFSAADMAEGAPWVVVINESMARQFWGKQSNQNPLGQRLHFGSDTWRTVVGVVGDVLHEGLDGEAKAEMYVPIEEAPNTESGPTIVLRASLDTAAAAAEIRAAVTAIDRGMPVDRIEAMADVVSASVSPPRFRAVILAGFSLLALVMASIGIYGVMNYLVIQRTREFGIRLSVGAAPGDVLRLVLRRAAVLIGVGTIVGLAGSVMLVRLISNLLFGTAPLDATTFIAAPALLAGVALVASYIPARRATLVDPAITLRNE